MKAHKALKVLGISRPTLYKLVKEGKLKANKQFNNYLDFDDEDVFRLSNKMEKRLVCVYGRVSTRKQKQDLENQKEKIINFVNLQGETVDLIFSDIASGINFQGRKDFFKLLDLILQGKVSKVYITHKDRLSRIGFELFKHLFSQFATQIVVMSEVGNSKQDSEEIFEDIISLLHCYAMKMYSKRKGNSIEIKSECKE